MSVFKDHKISLKQVLEFIPEALLTHLSATSKVDHYSKVLHGKKMFYLLLFCIFDNSKLTAANMRLPFGTQVKITNLRTGKSVVVRINDRGPFHRSRAFDMTKAAFKVIGDHSSGTIPIEYEIVD